MDRNLSLFIEDILEAINDIENSVKGFTKDQFIKNKDVKEANIRRIEIIGEAVKNIPDSFRNKYPDISWKDFAGIRDIIIHGYFKVDLETVWNVIEKDLPDLKQKILKIKEDLEEREKEREESKKKLKKRER